MRTITVEEAVRALNEAVASKGYDYIDPDAASGNSCRNVKYTIGGDLVPSCIVGTALVWLGVPVEWFRLRECESHSIYTLSGDLRDTGTLDITEDALEILSVAQGQQDQRQPWGVAVTRAVLGFEWFNDLEPRQVPAS